MVKLGSVDMAISCIIIVIRIHREQNFVFAKNLSSSLISKSGWAWVSSSFNYIEFRLNLIIINPVAFGSAKHI